MNYTYHIRSGHKHPARRPLIKAWGLAAICAAAICAFMIWVVVEICGHTQVIRTAEGMLPRNTVDMHNTYIGSTQVVPPFIS